MTRPELADQLLIANSHAVSSDLPHDAPNVELCTEHGRPHGVA